MKENIIKNNATITTLEIADMLGIAHNDILRKLDGRKDRKGYIDILTESQMAVSDYFIPFTYQDASGKENKCYLVTKLGCDFLANKFTGEKGVLFTAKYVKRFRDMEEHINNSKPRTALEQLQLQSQAILEVNDKIDEVKQELEDFKQDMPLMNIECDRITTAVRKVGTRALGGKDSNAYHDKSLSGKVYTDIYRELKRQFQVTSYKSIKRRQCDTAISIIEGYQLPVVLKEQIQNSNAQMNMEVL